MSLPDLRNTILSEALAGQAPSCRWAEIRSQFKDESDPKRAMVSWYRKRGVGASADDRREPDERLVPWVRFMRI